MLTAGAAADVAIEDAPVVTQYEMHGVEELGLLKMDFLGLRNLDVIADTLELIERTQGIVVDIDDVDLTDVPTYELLRRADTIGVFQLEGGAMRGQKLSPAVDLRHQLTVAGLHVFRQGPFPASIRLPNQPCCRCDSFRHAGEVRALVDASRHEPDPSYRESASQIADRL